MLAVLLFIHSIVRWLLLIVLIYALVQSYKGWKSGLNFTKTDGKIRLITVLLAHLQLIIGLGLYFMSPAVKSMMQNFKEAMGNVEARFFGMEHALMMFIAVILITIGGAKAKRGKTHTAKFKAMFIWFSIALLIILISIPWSLTPFGPDRPLFRGF